MATIGNSGSGIHKEIRDVKIIVVLDTVIYTAALFILLGYFITPAPWSAFELSASTLDDICSFHRGWTPDLSQTNDVAIHYYKYMMGLAAFVVVVGMLGLAGFLFKSVDKEPKDISVNHFYTYIGLKLGLSALAAVICPLSCALNSSMVGPVTIFFIYPGLFYCWTAIVIAARLIAAVRKREREHDCRGPQKSSLEPVNVNRESRPRRKELGNVVGLKMTTTLQVAFSFGAVAFIIGRRMSQLGSESELGSRSTSTLLDMLIVNLYNPFICSDLWRSCDVQVNDNQWDSNTLILLTLYVLFVALSQGLMAKFVWKTVDNKTNYEQISSPHLYSYIGMLIGSGVSGLIFTQCLYRRRLYELQTVNSLEIFQILCLRIPALVCVACILWAKNTRKWTKLPGIYTVQVQVGQDGGRKIISEKELGRNKF